MGRLQNLVLGGSLGLAGIVADSYASDTVPGEQKSSIVPLVDKNFDKEITQYDGAALVLFYSTQSPTDESRAIAENKEDSFFEVASKYGNSKVNGLPIKFGVFDVQQYAYQGMNKEQLYGRLKELYHVNSLPATVMYKDGLVVDISLGGPVTVQKIPNDVKAQTAWIDTNLLGLPFEWKGQNVRWVYNGSMDISAVAAN